MVKVVVDTNVLISGLIGHGKPRRLIGKLFREHELITSEEMISELTRVLTREKFSGIKRGQINRFLSILSRRAHVVRIAEPLNLIAEDVDDNFVLSTAWEGGAGYIVSGDRHLLSLKEFRGIRIVTVSEILEFLEN